MKAPLVGLYSPVPQSGKSTLAAILERYGFRRLRFAGPLKGMLRTLLLEAGCPIQDLDRYVEGDLKEAPTSYLAGRTPRHAMQTLGTEWGRASMHPDFWRDTLMLRAAALRQTNTPVVVDDVRFLNEAQAIREAGGILVRIVRPSLPVPASAGHVSEGGLDGFAFDLEVVNDASCGAQFGLTWGPVVEAVAYGKPELCGRL